MRAEDADAYLREVAARAFPPQVRGVCHVHREATENVARGIVEHLRELAPDTVIMTQHGRDALRNMLFGNLAQQVMGMADCPVLLVRHDPQAPAQPPAGGLWRRILVPHEGTAAHEPALPAAVSLAKLCVIPLHLLWVVPTRATLGGSERQAAGMLPGAVQAVLDLEQKEAVGHLEADARRLVGEGLEATAEVARGDPARAIARAARTRHADLIVLATHGHAGTQAFWTGSTAARVLQRCDTSLLLVPAAELGHA